MTRRKLFELLFGAGVAAVLPKPSSPQDVEYRSGAVRNRVGFGRMISVDRTRQMTVYLVTRYACTTTPSIAVQYYIDSRPQTEVFTLQTQEEP